MIFDIDWRMRRLKRKIAGTKGRLETINAFINICEKKVPGHLVSQAIDLVEKLRKSEEALSQLVEIKQQTPANHCIKN